MIKISKTALLPYSPRQLYGLVLQVQNYPLFLPWCTSAVIHTQDEVFQDATVFVQKSVVKEKFRTHNTLTPGKSIHMQLVEGPFKTLVGDWEFVSVGEGTQISFHLEFEVKMGPLQGLLEMTFKQMTQSMLEAFCKHAHQVLAHDSN